MNTAPLKSIWKKGWPYLLAALVFVILTLAYCSPVLDGKVLQAGDNLTWRGAYEECKTYTEQTGKHSFWTGSMFSGMPNYQIGGGQYQAVEIMRPLINLLRFGLHNETLIIILSYFVCFFVLMRAFKMNVLWSTVGSIALTFSSYFFIIIAAGHNTKAIGIAWMSAVLAGFVLMYRRKYLWGIVVTVLSVYMGLLKHPQMSYYIVMLMGLLFFAELYTHIKEKRLKDFGIATLLFLASVALGTAPQYSSLRANNEYLTETMRGKHSDLTASSDKAAQSADAKSDKGLDIEYATAWSYGLDESFTLLIPDFKGGANGYQLGEDSKLYKTLVSQGINKRAASEFCQSLPMYWGTQPFTSGPVYVGAIVCFLFVLGLIVVKGPYKWALLLATIFSLLLSWGKNFMPFTEFFFNWFPFYNRFRTVSSILIVAEIAMPLLAFMGIKTIINKEIETRRAEKALYISAGITAGLCLFFALFGKSLYNFAAPNDAQMFSQLPKWLSAAIVEQRAVLFTADAWRSFLFIVLAAGLLWCYLRFKIKGLYVGLLTGVLVLVDMWPVNQRFFNQGNFVSKREDKAYFQMQPYEAEILKDKDPHFRVFNLAANTFNDSRTSYRLKSLGGYHAAKLRRYQDLIDQHLSQRHMPVINMLNAKYVVVPTAQGAVAQLNQQAMGNAWIADTVMLAATPDRECAVLNEVDLTHIAVVGQDFADCVKDFQPGVDPTAQIRLSSYAPDELNYQSFSKQEVLAVFSEIYYPYGWKAYIDGQPVEHFRADYALRALRIPAGNHDIRFLFRPDSVYKTGIVSSAAAVLIYVLLAFVLLRAAVILFKRLR